MSSFNAIGHNPFDLFDEWLCDAQKSEPNDPNAMCLSTVNKDGKPSSRMVLLKDHGTDGFTFFTNSESQKGTDLAHNPFVALCFHWKSLTRQIRIEGNVEMVEHGRTEAYFHSRMRESQIASYASDQSRPLKDKAIYEERIKKATEEFEGQDTIPCPKHWNGYRVTPTKIEFWNQAPYRTHDRFVFVQNDNGEWEATRLYP